MSRFDALSARLEALETGAGYVTLPDGTRFKADGALALMRECLRFERDTGRTPKLSDFPEADQATIRGYAKMVPDGSESGETSMIIEISRKIIEEVHGI
jgi:hypothetical protein